MTHEMIAFLLTSVFSFLVGLEVKTYRSEFHRGDPRDFFGSARTFTFTGIIGFLFALLDGHYGGLYLGGLAVLAVLYALFYSRKLAHGQQSVLLFLVLMIVYALGPLSLAFPVWMSALVFVLIVFVLNARQSIVQFTTKINTYEFETLGKMVLLSAVILPLLPDRDIIPLVPLSPYKIWLAVVVISAISYGGYLLQRYVFPGKGLFLTGLLGGSYSSTATTVVLARKAAAMPENPLITGAIVAATAVMYLRLVVIAFIFNAAIGKTLLLPFAGFAAAAFAIAGIYVVRGSSATVDTEANDKNPLELGTALLFAVLFVVMIVATQYVTETYGSGGLKLLSFLVGLTDIDPFILSLLTGKYSVASSELHAAIVIAAGSNNILKAFYALWFAGGRRGTAAFVWLVLLGVATIAAGLFGPL